MTVKLQLFMVCELIFDKGVWLMENYTCACVRVGTAVYGM